MDFAQPPPNLALPPPNLVVPNQQQGYMNRQPFRPFMNMMKPLPGPLGNMTLEDFDGKRLRKSVMRKTVDYNSAIIKELENRVWQRDYRDRRALQPDAMYYPDMMPPPSYQDNPINCVTTRFVKTATNKMRCPIFCMAWTPEGRRLVTGASSGEFTLWNGLTFNFETILQAHDSPVRTMVWSHNDSWMITGDHAGYVKYWQSNMNNVKMFQAHKEALRGISFSPSDAKFVTCSDDGTLRIWDFFRYQEERILRGHGADVKCCHWHPQKGLIISGSKDNQQPIKLWDPKTGQSLATLHAHKSTVMDLKWNENGNWLITASRDHLLKLFDLRNLSQEVQTFRGHKKEASSVAWHPVHEGLFCSGGSDGAIMFWHVGADKEVGAIEQAHDSIVWTLAWHPLGHILCSGSNDHSSKFWTRNRPGDQMKDKYNLNTLPAGIAGLEDLDMMGEETGSVSIIPGMGPEDKVEITSIITDENQAIPGLDLDNVVNEEKPKPKKVPFSKPIPRNFQAQWNETVNDDASGLTEVINQIVENTPGVVPLQQIAPNAIIIYGKLIPVDPGSKLEQAIADGPDALSKYIASGEIEELHDVMPINDDDDEDYLKDDIDDSYNNENSNNGPINQSSNNAASDRDTDLRSSKDQDMRFNSMGDVDFRKDLDFRNNKKDIDFRNDLDFRNQNQNHRDFDMRKKLAPSQRMDEDFRNYNDNYSDDGYNDDKYNDNLNYNDYDDYGEDDYRDDDYRNDDYRGDDYRDDDYRDDNYRHDDYRENRRYDNEDYNDDFYDDGLTGSSKWQRNNPKFNDFRGSRGSQQFNSSFRGGSHQGDHSSMRGSRDGGPLGGAGKWNGPVPSQQNDFRSIGRGNRKMGRGDRAGPRGRGGGNQSKGRGISARGRKSRKGSRGGIQNDSGGSGF